jgi:hypothetical protein
MEGSLLWTVDGAWLQAPDDLGRVRSSYLGKLSFEGCQAFCRKRGIPLDVIRPPEPRRAVNRSPVGTSEPWSRVNRPVRP